MGHECGREGGGEDRMPACVVLVCIVVQPGCTVTHDNIRRIWHTTSLSPHLHYTVGDSQANRVTVLTVSTLRQTRIVMVHGRSHREGHPGGCGFGCTGAEDVQLFQLAFLLSRFLSSATEFE